MYYTRYIFTASKYNHGNLFLYRYSYWRSAYCNIVNSLPMYGIRLYCWYSFKDNNIFVHLINFFFCFKKYYILSIKKKKPRTCFTILNYKVHVSPAFFNARRRMYNLYYNIVYWHIFRKSIANAVLSILPPQ